jgi:hypothetical protein
MEPPLCRHLEGGENEAGLGAASAQMDIAESAANRKRQKQEFLDA